MFVPEVIGVAGGGTGDPGSLPNYITSNDKNYDNIAKRYLVAVLFSVITYITVIYNNINDYEGYPGPLTNDQWAPYYQLGGPGVPN